ncbi:MAG: hypothetical protein V2A71_11215 [Candidatus Eisenbacteria bacterium]
MEAFEQPHKLSFLFVRLSPEVAHPLYEAKKAESVCDFYLGLEEGALGTGSELRDFV